MAKNGLFTMEALKYLSRFNPGVCPNERFLDPSPPPLPINCVHDEISYHLGLG